MLYGNGVRIRRDNCRRFIEAHNEPDGSQTPFNPGAPGLASEATLGNQLWALHQAWLHEERPLETDDDVLVDQALLGIQVNRLVQAWLEEVLDNSHPTAQPSPAGA